MKKIFITLCSVLFAFNANAINFDDLNAEEDASLSIDEIRCADEERNANDTTLPHMKS